MLRAHALTPTHANVQCASFRGAQIRNNPYGHDARSMAQAMGKHWGSNVDRTIKAKEQAAKVDTSNPDDDDDDITMA